MQNPVTQALALGYQSDSAPDVDAVINRFFYTHPYVKGSRTRTMLSLGQYLRWRRVQPWQLDQAIHTACARGVEPGITPKEIERAVRWGYEHGNEGGNNQTNWVHKVHNSYMNPNSAATSAIDPDNEEITEDEKEEEEIIEDQCTQFSDDIYEHLPDEIKKLLVVAKDRKEKDIILLGILTVSSTLFPALRTIYVNRSNFYKLLPILKKLPDTFRYSDFWKEVEKVGLYPNAAKRALKKYVVTGLLTKDNCVYKKTNKLKKRFN
ncbi:hypothetical protein [Bacteroides caecigallinarum]|uniref:hypothetical protein n=1 Tax=Bacteroides caecigallinarum TaxID=1411144 RepID=UPI001956341F|nr:hypothetical protein [Bacteroides caecigallinarum]MBM6883880.1 hypothetical protein [Bacteroides caecigallinarum]